MICLAQRWNYRRMKKKPPSGLHLYKNTEERDTFMIEFFMKYRAKLRLGAYLLVAVAIVYSFIGSPEIRANREGFKDRVKMTNTDTVIFEMITPFAWDSVYSFSPYADRNTIVEVLGIPEAKVQTTDSEGMVQLIFVYKDKVVCDICEHPSNVGYDIIFGDDVPMESHGEYSYYKIDYGSAVRFNVEHEGDMVILNGNGQS